MTALNVIQFAGEIHMFGDTAHYGSNAVLTKFKPKIHAVPTARAIIGFSGRSVLGETVREWVAGVRSIEELIEGAEVAVRWMIENTDLGKMAHTILVAGFTGDGDQQLWKMHFNASETKAPKFSRMRSTEWEFRPSTQIRKVGGGPLSAAEIHSHLYDFCRTVLTAQRNTKQSINGWNNGVPASIVGGDGILVTVTPDQITQRVVISWPDAAGHSVCLDDQIASVGINSGESSNYDVNGTIGYVAPTSTPGTSQVPTMTSNTTPSGVASASPSPSIGSAYKAFDGASTAAEVSWNTASLPVVLQYQFGSDKVIQGYVLRLDSVFDSVAVGGWKAWTFEGSNDGSSWDTLDTRSGVTLTGNADNEFSFANTMAYSYYRWRVTLAGSARASVSEAKMIGPPMINDMTLVTAYQEPDLDGQIIDKGRVLIEYDASDNPELNVDLIAEVTCDGGANWVPGTLELFSKRLGNGGDLHHGAETEQVSCPPGTSVAARIKVLNGKDVKIHCLSLDWR